MNEQSDGQSDRALEGRLQVALHQELDSAPVDTRALITATRLRTRQATVRRRTAALVAVALATSAVGYGTYAALTSQSGGPGTRTDSPAAGRPSGASAPGPFTSWRQEPAPPWTPRTPPPSPSDRTTPGSIAEPTLRPSPSPPETPQPGDVPAYVVPRSASLRAAEVPSDLILMWDQGPTLHRARVLPTMETCEYSNMGEEKLGGSPIGGQEWDWAGNDPFNDRELVHTVTAFAAGTGHARFEDVKRQRLAEQCYFSSDPAVITATAKIGEAFILTATVPLPTEVVGQYAAGVARVGDVLVGVEVLTGSRRDMVPVMENLLNDAVVHLQHARPSGLNS